jgi:hypothetical protein
MIPTLTSTGNAAGHMTCDDRKLKDHVNTESRRGAAVGVAISRSPGTACRPDKRHSHGGLPGQYPRSGKQKYRNTVAVAGV